MLLFGRCCDVLEDVGIDNGFDDLDDVDALVDVAVVVLDVLLKVEEDVVFCSLFGDVSTSIYVLELVGNVSSTISLAF